jgi:NitT/TauT family transport system ATP-binding protein
MISIRSIDFAYSSVSPLFENFSLEISRGETWAILGPSGCGKTTVLYLLAGLRFPSRGKIDIDNESLVRPRPHSGLILQDYGLLPWSTVRENVELGLHVRKFYREDGTHAPINFQPENSVTYWLERLGIKEVADTYPSQISGGQRQRTAIADVTELTSCSDEPFSRMRPREDLQT